jgi:hypothetical protein
MGSAGTLKSSPITASPLPVSLSGAYTYYVLTVLIGSLLSLSCFYGSRTRRHPRAHDLGFTDAGPAEDWPLFAAQHRCFVRFPCFSTGPQLTYLQRLRHGHPEGG